MPTHENGTQRNGSANGSGGRRPSHAEHMTGTTTADRQSKWQRSKGGLHVLSTGRSLEQEQQRRRSQKIQAAQDLVINTDDLIDENALRHMKAQFEAFDVDDSGAIEASEFIAICRRVGMSKNEALNLVKVALAPARICRTTCSACVCSFVVSALNSLTWFGRC